MDSLSSIILGIVQGLTEFLPISSSGHLVLFQKMLGFHEPELLLDTSLHIGTLVAVLIYFRSDVAAMVGELRGHDRPKGARGSGPLPCRAHGRVHGDPGSSCGNIPTAVIGLVFKDPLERLFGSVTVVGAMLMVTGLLLLITRFVPPGKRRLGLPGGTGRGYGPGPCHHSRHLPVRRETIACGILMGLDRDLAARFSFLLSHPRHLRGPASSVGDRDGPWARARRASSQEGSPRPS